MPLTIRHDGRYNLDFADVHEINKLRRTEIIERITSLISYNVAPYVTSWTYRGNDGNKNDLYRILTSFQERETPPAFFETLLSFTASTKLTLMNIRIDEGVLNSENFGKTGMASKTSLELSCIWIEPFYHQTHSI